MVRGGSRTSSTSTRTNNQPNNNSKSHSTSSSSSRTSPNVNHSSYMDKTTIEASGHYNRALHHSDKCHNNAIPCCKAIRDIVQELFPDVIAYQNLNAIAVENTHNNNNILEGYNNHNGDDTLTQLDNNNQVHSHEQQRNGKKNQKSSNHHSVTFTDAARTTSYMKSSLLSQIIRHYFLEQRRSSNCNSGNHKECVNEQSPSQSKKKRKKKKKKQQPSMTSSEGMTMTTTASSIVTTSYSSTNLESNYENEGWNISHTTAVSTNIHVSKLPTLPVQQDDKNEPSSKATLSSSAASPLSSKEYADFGTTNCATNTQFNSLLDHILLQQEQNYATTTSTSSSLPTISYTTPPPPPKNRTLESLFEYIHDKFYYHHQVKNTKSTKKSKVVNTASTSSETTTSTKKNMTLRIPFRELSSIICQNITCGPCRRDTELYLHEISKTSIDVINGDELHHSYCSNHFSSHDHNTDNSNGADDDIIIQSFHLDLNSVAISEKNNIHHQNGPHGLINDYYDDSTNENLFDYTLMEEGKQQHQQQEKLQGHEINQGLKINVVNLRNSNGDGTKYIELSMLDSPLSLTKFVDLIQHIIVPCGLHELENYQPIKSRADGEGREIVSQDDIAEVKERYHDLYSEIHALVIRAHDQCAKINNSLNDILASSGVTCSFNAKASQAIRECEKEQFDYMQVYADLLIKVQRYTAHARLAKHDQRKWIIDVIDKMWANYEDTIKSFVRPSLEHFWKVIQLDTEHTDSVPSTYNCPVRRQYSIDLVTIKAKAIVKLQIELDNLLETSNPYVCDNSHNLAKLVGISCYFSLMAQHNNEPSSKEHVYKDLLTQRNDLVCNSIGRSKVSKLLQAQSTRINELRNKSRKLVNDIDNQKGVIKTVYYPPKVFELEWTTNKIFIEEKMMDDETFMKNETSLDCDLAEVSNLCNFVEFVTKQCRLYGDIIIKGNVDHGNSEYKIPEWLRTIDLLSEKSEEREEVSSTRISNYKRCNGGGGQRRVMCILSACIYSWVKERSMEWNADLTHEELLMDVEEEFSTLNNPAPHTILRGKKSKKKKRKSISKQEDSQHIELNIEDVSPRDTIIKDSIGNNNHALSHESIKDDTENILDVKVEFEKDVREEVSILSNEQGSKSNKSLLKLNEGGVEGNMMLGDEDELNINIIVSNKNSSETVKEYLCNRFLQVLEDEDFIIY